jgi:hypothetical protein
MQKANLAEKRALFHFPHLTLSVVMEDTGKYWYSSTLYYIKKKTT